MPRLKQREDVYFTTVRGMCRNCAEIRPARVFFRDGRVWQQALCPTCETQPAMIASNVGWYLREILEPLPDVSPLACASEPVGGCPHDCGPCTWHASNCQLPVLSITNACDLNCPICFTYNRPDRIYHISVEEMNRTLDWVVESSGSVDLINLTGGEPTLHPDLPEILRCCKRAKIGRITMNSNGLRLSRDKELCRLLAEMDVCVILSLNTFDPAISRKIHGRDLVSQKRSAIDNLTEAGVRMTLLNVLIRETNEESLKEIFELLKTNDQILSLTVQTMTYTGQGGGRWQDRRHIPVDEATEIVCSQSGGMLEASDFMARPSTHPLCYRLCYAMKTAGGLLPLSRLFDRDRLAGMLRDSYLIRLEDGESLFREAIDQLYSRGKDQYLPPLRKLIERLFPQDRVLDDARRQREAESAIKTVYIHSHMDEETFDAGRAMHCTDLVPAEPGRLIPACTYNLFYRKQDERFYVPHD